MFDSYGMSLQQFNEYVDECKKLGYTVNKSSFDDFYSVDNSDGYNIYLSYNSNYKMSGSLKEPDND